MISPFSKYNLTSSSNYETFIYYDEVEANGLYYYVQFMYAGYKNAEVMSQTFHTNLTESDNPIWEEACKIIFNRFSEYIRANKELPHYILAALVFHLNKIN
jgi:hypothetical protein